MVLEERESYALNLSKFRQGQSKGSKTQVGPIWAQILTLALTGSVTPKQAP